MQRLSSHHRLVATAIVAFAVVAALPAGIVYFGPSDDTSLRGVRSAATAPLVATQEIAVAQKKVASAALKKVTRPVSFMGLFGFDKRMVIFQLRQAGDLCTANIAGVIKNSGVRSDMSGPILNRAQSEINSAIGQYAVRLSSLGQAPAGSIDAIRFTALGNQRRDGTLAGTCLSASAEVNAEIQRALHPPHRDEGDGDGGGD